MVFVSEEWKHIFMLKCTRLVQIVIQLEEKKYMEEEGKKEKVFLRLKLRKKKALNFVIFSRTHKKAHKGRTI